MCTNLSYTNNTRTLLSTYSNSLSLFPQDCNVCLFNFTLRWQNCYTCNSRIVVTCKGLHLYLFTCVIHYFKKLSKFIFVIKNLCVWLLPKLLSAFFASKVTLKWKQIIKKCFAEYKKNIQQTNNNRSHDKCVKCMFRLFKLIQQK